jgi:uncharacterized protein YndB with AHSA1/START domain
MAAATSKAESAAAAGAAEEMVITRRFEAPRELVFEAWSKAEHLREWFVPFYGSVPYCTVDFRVGGRFHFCMRFKKRDIWGIGEYCEIVALEQIVYVDRFADEHGNPVPPSHYGFSAAHPAATLVTVTFAEHGRNTLLTLRQAIPEAVPERQACEQGWREMFDRLAAHVTVR